MGVGVFLLPNEQPYNLEELEAWGRIYAKVPTRRSQRARKRKRESERDLTLPGGAAPGRERELPVPCGIGRRNALS